MWKRIGAVVLLVQNRRWPSPVTNGYPIVGGCVSFLQQLRSLALFQRATPPISAPPAAPQSMNPIGGIESVSIDGRHYYFGFDYSSDEVLSPLFDDAGAIASYAANHMSQRDGDHDAAYWLDAAEHSIDESGLCDDDGRLIDTEALKKVIQEVRSLSGTGQRVRTLVLSHHLTYLLHAACDWPRVSPPMQVQAAATRIGLDADDAGLGLSGSEDILNGRQGLPRGASYVDAAVVFLWYWDTLTSHLRHGWDKHFKF
jgi:hypothetical protein